MSLCCPQALTLLFCTKANYCLGTFLYLSIYPESHLNFILSNVILLVNISDQDSVSDTRVVPLHCFLFELSPKKTFCGFSRGKNQYWPGRVYDLCVYYMTGTPEGPTESGFMEKPGIKPGTPGLQGIALIQYTTGASLP